MPHWIPRPLPLPRKSLPPTPDTSEDGVRLANFYREQEEGWVAQAQAVSWSARVFTETEESSFAAGGGGGRYVAVVQRQPTAGPARMRNLAWADEDPRPTPAFVPEEEAGVIPAVQVRDWAATVFTDEEAAHGLPLEDEAATYPAVQARPWVALAFLDEDATPQNFPLEQEEPWVAYCQARPWVPVNFPDEDPGAPLADFPLEQEDSWPQLLQARPWGTFTVLDEHPFATPPTNLFDDEQPPLVSVNTAQARPWTPLYFPEEGAGSPLQNFPLEQEEPWAGARQELRWPVTQAYTDTDERGILPPLEDGESLRLTSLARQAVPWLPLPFTDEHAGAPLKNFPLDQEEGWTARTTTLTWQARVFLDEAVTVVSIPPVPAVVTLTDRYAPTVTLTGRVGR
jgi:hypothetical protein